MVDKIEKAPALDSGSGVTEGLGSLADAQLGDVKSLGSQTTDSTAGNAIADSSAFEFTNEQGHNFQTDENGRVSSFTYNDADGNPLRSFSEIVRDDQGAVTSFKDSDGYTWTKQPADPTSPWPAEREGGGWISENKDTGEVSKSADELGNVVIDETGVSGDGPQADYLQIPEDE